MIYERRHDNVHISSIIICELCQFKIKSKLISLGAINLALPSRAGRFNVSLNISSSKQFVFHLPFYPLLSYTLSYQSHQEQEEENNKNKEKKKNPLPFVLSLLHFTHITFWRIFLSK
jgi:hypothetical protein